MPTKDKALDSISSTGGEKSVLSGMGKQARRLFKEVKHPVWKYIIGKRHCIFVQTHRMYRTKSLCKRKLGAWAYCDFCQFNESLAVNVLIW